MATWGEFIAEFKVVNLKSQGMFVKVDEVLDLFDERARLRTELAELRDQQPQSQSAVTGDASVEVAQERERCARDVEEFADACAAEPDQPEYIATVLRMAATLIRERGQVPTAEEVGLTDETSVEGVPTAEMMDAAGDAANGIPTAHPIAPDDTAQ